MFLLSERQETIWSGDVNKGIISTQVLCWEVTRMDELTHGAMFQQQATDERNMKETKNKPRGKKRGKKSR